MNNRNIIIFGDDWGRYPSTIQHIGRVFAEKNRLLWIGSLGLRKPEFSLYDVKRIWEKGKGILAGSGPGEQKVKTAKDVTEVYPFIIPFHDNAFMYSFSMRMIRNKIRKIMRSQDFRDPILITASPIMHSLIGELNETSSHYLCLDDFTLFDGAFKTLGEKEQILVSKVDSSFSISESLMATRRVKSRHNYFFPQGVDTKHFSPSTTEIHPSVASIKHPVIGFFGIITTWVDVELIVECAKAYPEYQFVILGKTTVDLTLFSTIPNIRYIGPVPFEHLPQYARIFDIGIIPFVVNDLTIACNPLKLLEYLSLGIPVVSTNMPEVKKMEPNVIIADSREQFVASIRTAVSSISEQGNAARRIFAEKYSWRSIAEDISNKIMEIEEEKKVKKS
ncbi:MAG: glycosyltransferase [Bacteroidota bacterium]